MVSRYIAESALLSTGILEGTSQTGQDGYSGGSGINARWLIGAVLSAVAGGGLISSAMIYSLDRTQSAIDHPEIIAATRIDTTSPDQQTLKKGNRLVTGPEIGSVRQAFKALTPVVLGDHELIKLKPYVRVATALTQSAIGYAQEVPTFEPLKLFSGPNSDDVQQPEIRTSDQETDVSLQRFPLSVAANLPDDAPMLGMEQIETQIEEARRAALTLGRAMPLSIGGQEFLARTLPAAATAGGTGSAQTIEPSFSAIQISLVPENVTTIGKQLPSPQGMRLTMDERVVPVRRGEAFNQLLLGTKISAESAREAANVLTQNQKDGLGHDNQRLRILLSMPQNKAKEPTLLRAILYESDIIVAIAALNDRGSMVSVPPPPVEGTPVVEAAAENEDNPNGLRIYDSVYETGLKNDIPKPVIEQFLKICFYDFDLEQKINGGDTFEVLYAEDEDNSGRYDVLYASLSVAGVVKRYYQHKSKEDGTIDYFDEQGKSNRKFLMRKPISEGILRSGFGMRYHPVLHVWKLHSGIDWANRIGTPILAAGDGVVTWADWDTGYGRHIEIQHAYDFTTTYSHLSAFAKGISEGTHVKQGQIIGYLGNSGLSTGPHLHYEILVKGEFKDPLAIKLPRNRELTTAEMPAFKGEQEVINGLIAQSPGLAKSVEKVQ